MLCFSEKLEVSLTAFLFLILYCLTSFPPRVKAATEAFSKLIISISFVFTKQPMRIAQVLRQVYPVDPSNVDEELVER
jgi:hypothetical protein